MRSKHASLALLSLAAAFPLAAHAGASDSRQRILMDADWRFNGLAGETTGTGVPVTQWRWKPGAADDAAAIAAPGLDTSGADWRDARIGDDVFGGEPGFAWYRATLPASAKPGRVLHFESVDDNADVYLNGVKLASHTGWDDPFDVSLDRAWNANGPNVVAVRVENTGGGGGIMRAVTLQNESASGLALPKTGWTTVHLPHDYIVQGKFTPKADASHGSLPTYPAWYEKTFTIPASYRGKSVWIDFDGVYRDARVYFNGVFLTEHKGGYTPFRCDIGKLAKYGAKNTLEVHVDPRHQEGWWYEGGGIYRHVWLNAADPLHVAPWGTFVTSNVKDPLGKPSATLAIQTTLDNASSAAETASLVSEVIGPDGKRVARVESPVSVPAGASGDVRQTEVPIPDARLWSLEHPQLYRLHTEVVKGGKVVDAVDTPFGIRTIRFDPEKGFFLNERPVKIKGTCNHQDFAGVGIGVPDTLEYWRVKKLQEMGSNAWRMSHNPPTESVLDACDKLGMLVMDENRHLGDTFSAKTGHGATADDLSELDTMILRDRNHPSIIMWSMCNEEPLQSTQEGAAIFTAMRSRVLQLDPTRPVTCAMNDGAYHGIALVEDLRGFNYGPWEYAPYHRDHPDIPLYGSETGSTVSTRGVYSWDKFQRDGRTYTGEEDQGYVSAYDTNAPGWAQTAEQAWQPIADHDYMAGGFVWTGFDYKGEPTPFGWPCINSHFGILDEAGFPKDLFYYYQSVWGDKPMAHILPHWNWPGQEGKPIPVWVYSNGDRVELFLNGASLGAKDMPRNGHLEWSVPYAPGTLEARAYAGGKLIATDRVETTGAPAALRLSADRTKLAADGEDLIPVEVDVVDDHGRIVPTASDRITFAVTGAGHIAGVGNGDPSDHDPDQADYRRAFNGKALAIVGAGDARGEITLTASAPGLKGATLRLSAR